MRSALRSTKNWAKGYSEAEVLVRDCTCNEDGPPDPRKLRQLANLTLTDLQSYKSVWTLLWNRTKHFQYIRHVQRGLQTIEYLLLNGHERIVQDVSDNLITIKRLTTYKYYKDGSREVAGDVRDQAKRLLTLMEDMDALKKKREDAAKNRPKMGAITGFGSDSMKKATEPQVKGDIQTVHKWQDSPTTPPAASNDDPGATSGEEDSAPKKKKKKKKKKKNKGEESTGADAAADFDAFPDIDFGEMPQEKEPAALVALDAPAAKGKVKVKKGAAPAQADVIGFGLEPGASRGEAAEQPPPSGNFSFGEGDDWMSSLTAAPQQPAAQSSNLLDDVFSAPPATQQTASPIDIFGMPAATPPQQTAPDTTATPEKKTDSLYDGFVNTDDIFGTMPKKRQAKATVTGKTMSQLQAEKQLTNSFGTQSTPAQQPQQQNNIFTQMQQPVDPFAPQQQNPFGFGAPQQNPFGPAQPNPFGAPQQNPFGMQPQQPQPWGAPPVQQQPQPWGANAFQQPAQQQQQQNPFDKIGGWG